MMKQLLAGLLSVSLASATTELSRSDLIRHAVDSSESIVQIRSEQQSAVSIRKEYYGKALPTIEGIINYEHKFKSYNPYEFGLGGSGSSSISSMMNGGSLNDTILAGTLDKLMKGISSIDLTPKKNTYAMGIKVTQAVFAQGKVVTGLKIADVYYRSLEQKMEAEQLKLAKEITISWYGAVLAEKNLLIREESVKIAEESHRLAVARFLAGKGTQIDTMNTRYAVQESKSAVRSAKKDRRLAIEKMLTTASIKQNPDSVTVELLLEPIDFTMEESEAQTILAKNNRTVTQLNEAVQLQKLQTSLAKTDYLPTVYAGGAFMGISQFNDPENIKLGGDHKVFAGISIPIFSGGQRIQKLNQAGYAEEKLSSQKQSAENLLNLALSAQYEELDVAREEFDEAQEMVNLTEKARTISVKAFEVGQITQQDLTMSEQNARLAKLSQNAAVFKINSAVTSIRELIGDESLVR